LGHSQALPFATADASQSVRLQQTLKAAIFHSLDTLLVLRSTWGCNLLLLMHGSAFGPHCNHKWFASFVQLVPFKTIQIFKMKTAMFCADGNVSKRHDIKTYDLFAWVEDVGN